MKKTFRGRVYLGNTWPFYLLFLGLLAIGFWFHSGGVEINWAATALEWGITTEKVGFWLIVVSFIAIPWMLLNQLNIFKWYTVDDQGISLIRFGATWKKFLFSELSNIKKLSAEETKELLYAEFAPTLLFRRMPMEEDTIGAIQEKTPRAFRMAKDIIQLTRYSTVPIVKAGINTGYQYPTIEDAKKVFKFLTKGPFVLLTTKENKHALMSPKNIDEFLQTTKQKLSI